MRKIFMFVILFMLLFIINVFGIDLMVNEDKVVFTESSGNPFIDENERTQVPLRVAMEKVGAVVGWNESTQVATVEKGDIKIEVSIGKKHIIVNGEIVNTDTEAVVKNSRTYLPIRAVAEALGLKVFWDDETSTVILSTNSTDMYVVNGTGENSKFKWLKNHELSNEINIFYYTEKDGNMLFKQTKHELKKKIDMADTIKWTNLDKKEVVSTRAEIYQLIEYNVVQRRLFSIENGNKMTFNPYSDNLDYIYNNATEFYEDWANSGAARATDVDIIVDDYLDGFQN